MKLLLDKNADANFKDSDSGRTLLSRAVENDHEAVMKLLVDRHADIESKDKYGALIGGQEQLRSSGEAAS